MRYLPSCRSASDSDSNGSLRRKSSLESNLSTNGLQFQHLACFTCLTASINIVGANGTKARCTYCHKVVLDFAPGHKANQLPLQTVQPDVNDLSQLEDRPPYSRRSPPLPSISDADSLEPVVLRIDNIAWDATPDMLKQFLPAGVLADTIQPVHILLSRWDGRSKDFLVRPCSLLSIVYVPNLLP